MTPTNYTAEYRPRGDSGFWRLLAVQPTEAAAWETLLGADELRGHDLRVRPLCRGQPAGRAPSG